MMMIMSHYLIPPSIFGPKHRYFLMTTMTYNEFCHNLHIPYPHFAAKRTAAWHVRARTTLDGEERLACGSLSEAPLWVQVGKKYNRSPDNVSLSPRDRFRFLTAFALTHYIPGIRCQHVKDGEFLFLIVGGSSFVVCGSWRPSSNSSNLPFRVHHATFFHLGLDRFGPRDLEIHRWAGFSEILILGRTNFILF